MNKVPDFIVRNIARLCVLVMMIIMYPETFKDEYQDRKRKRKFAHDQEDINARIESGEAVNLFEFGMAKAFEEKDPYDFTLVFPSFESYIAAGQDIQLEDYLRAAMEVGKRFREENFYHSCVSVECEGKRFKMFENGEDSVRIAKNIIQSTMPGCNVQTFSQIARAFAAGEADIIIDPRANAGLEFRNDWLSLHGERPELESEGPQL